MMEIKYSTRLDSPFACAELYDEERKILGDGTILYIKAMCAKTDQSLLKYELNLTLSEQVEQEPVSYFGDLSNGKFFVNLTKVERPAKWKRLLADDQIKPSNMNFWWELYDKYEEELEELSPEDEEQEDLDALPDDGECPADDLWPKQKKQKKKAKKVGK